jgi:hypothetical protein
MLGKRLDRVGNPGILTAVDVAIFVRAQVQARKGTGVRLCGYPTHPLIPSVSSRSPAKPMMRATPAA